MVAKTKEARLQLKLSSIGLAIVCTVLATICIIGFSLLEARSSLLELAARSARDTGVLIHEKSLRILEPAQASLHLLTSTALVSAMHLDQRLTWLQTLTGLLDNNPVISSVYVGYEDGAFFLVRALKVAALRERFKAPDNAKFMVQSVQTSAKDPAEFLFFNSAHQLIERRWQPDYKFDPRTRAWYQSAQQRKESVFTEPYVFFYSEQLGLTLSQSSANGKAVVGVDVVLSALASNLASLRPTPHSQLALVNQNAEVIAYPDMQRVLDKQKNRIDLKTIDRIGIPSLAYLHAHKAQPNTAISFTVNGQEWLGISQPFNAFQAQGGYLLLASPSDDFLNPFRVHALHVALCICAIVLLLLPFGWFLSMSAFRSINRLTHLAERMRQFNFQSCEQTPTFLNRVNDLSSVMGDMGQTIEAFLQISHDIAAEPKVDQMLPLVLAKIVTATRCQGASVYLYDEAAHCMRQASMVGQLQGHATQAIDYQVAPDPSNAHEPIGNNLSELRIELRGRSGSTEGLLVLQHATDLMHADTAFGEFVQKLSGMLAVSIETRQLIEGQKNLLDALVRLMADAIDAKSPYTGGHCERVPKLAAMVVDHILQDTTGPYAHYSMTQAQRYEFHLAAWLHDCGKVTSPEHIIDKSTKLETIYNRIHEVRMRFEVLWRDADIAYWQALAQGGAAAELHQTLELRQAQLRDDFAFIAHCNIGCEHTSDADLQRLHTLGQTTWLRYFDNRLGLSIENLRRLQAVQPQPLELPCTEFLIADAPEHVVAWGKHKPPVEKNAPENHYGFDMQLPANAQNTGEMHNLTIRKGTLTQEDRFTINNHIVQTLIMLRRIPWPKHLARVPDLAASHHERLDGQGYPRKLNAAQLALPDRIMAMVDIFEALTAADRPYKAAKTLSESFRIMAGMARGQHIDAQLLRYFLDSGLWLDFAKDNLLPTQIDSLDLEEIHAMIEGQGVA